MSRFSGESLLSAPSSQTIPQNHPQELSCPWLVTYDDVPEIRKIYSSYVGKRYDLIYSLANNGKNSELMFLSDDALWPTEDELKEGQITINLRGEGNGE